MLEVITKRRTKSGAWVTVDVQKKAVATQAELDALRGGLPESKVYLDGCSNLVTDLMILYRSGEPLRIVRNDETP